MHYGILRLSAHRAGLPVEAPRKQTQGKTAERPGDGGDFTGKAQRIAQQKHGGAKHGGDGVEFAAFKDFRRASAEHIANAASAHGGDAAEQKRGQPVEAGVQGAGASGNGKQTQPGGIGKDDEAFRASANSRSKDHANGSAG